MSDTEPWYLTVVRTERILFLRPERAWRPIVSVTLVENGLTHETVLGIDGQNPNLKNPSVLRDVDHTTQLDIRVWHKPNSKNRKRRHMVGSAYHTLGDLARRQDRPGADVIIHLKCPPPQKRSPTIGGARNTNCATLVIRLRLPPSAPSSSSPSLLLVSAPTQNQEEVFSDGVFSDASLPASPAKEKTQTPWQQPTAELREISPPNVMSVLRLRKRPKSNKVRGYSVETSDEFDCQSSDSGRSICSYPHSQGSSSTSQTQVSPELLEDYFSQPAWTPVSEEVIKLPCRSDCSEDSERYVAMRILPRYAGQGSLPVDPAEVQLSLIETLLNAFSPYCEMSSPNCDFNRVLGRLLTEWYAIGASLLAAAGLNAAVFGFSPGTLFDVDGPARRSVAIGSIAAGIGMVCDAWFLVIYSGADGVKFQRMALDVYNTYVFFCLTCRLPTFCLFVSSCALMVFLLTVAWSAWPTAVLVMCCAAGVLVTLQYLIYGCHRVINFLIWTTARILGAFVRLFRRNPPSPKISVPRVSLNHGDADPEGVRKT